MKNKTIDLNNHLFAQLEKLADEDLMGDKLQEEIDRSKAMADVAKQIIDNQKIVIDVIKIADKQGIGMEQVSEAKKLFLNE